MDKTFANQLMVKMESDYNTIAHHFAQTRQQPWPEFSIVESLVVQTNLDCAILDVGCGNGRLAEFLEKIKGIQYTGLDISETLLHIARERYPQHIFVHDSMLQLPFTDAHFNLVAAIASLQHIPSRAYHIQALTEMHRVTKPGGNVFMLNWNLYQANLPDYFTAARTTFGNQWEVGDALVPWKNDQGEQLAMRYYHGFTIDELAELLTAAGWLIQDQYLSEHNIVTIAKW